MQIADQYFNNCREIAVRNPELMSKRVRYNVFARDEGILIGSNRAVSFVKENTYGQVTISGLRDGENFISVEPVLTIEGNFYELVTLETTILGFLSYSGAATAMNKIVKAADGIPVIDMSARHYPWQIIEEVSLAAYLGGAAGTSTQAGYSYVQRWYNPGDKFRLYASLPHAMAAVVCEMAGREKLFPSVMAAKLFHETFPEKTITVLTDYEGRELDVVKQSFELFGEKLFAVRLDTHGGRNMQGNFSLNDRLRAREYLLQKMGKNIGEVCKPGIDQEKYFTGNGVTVEAVFKMRDFLDQIGAKDTKIVVSSGFNEKKVAAFRKCNAPMDFIGTGSWVDFMMFTADISHVFENNEWFFRTKVGRIHKSVRNHKVLFERK